MDIRTEKMEEALFGALDAVDSKMEEKYGKAFVRHPARPAVGKAARPQYDGLFSIGAGFSAGFGSKFGPGYALTFRIVTLDSVPTSFRASFELEAVDLLKTELASTFPDRSLDIVKDVNGWKIVGDLTIS